MQTCSDFGAEALKAAFAAVRIIFVGPSGQQGKLERAALKIDDLRLRPHVIFNFLTLRFALHGGKAPPTLEDVKRLMAEHGGLPAHIAKHARRVYDVGVERATAASDVAGVRSAAQSADQSADADDAEAEAAPPGEALAPRLSGAGVLEFAPQDMGAVIAGIDNMVTRAARASTSPSLALHYIHPTTRPPTDTHTQNP